MLMKVKIINKKIINKSERILCIGYLENIASEEEIKQNDDSLNKIKEKYQNIQDYLDIENKIASIKNKEYIIKKHGKNSNEKKILENVSTNNSAYSVINNLDEAKLKCNELGFKYNSEKFGKCIFYIFNVFKYI